MKNLISTGSGICFSVLLACTPARHAPGYSGENLNSAIIPPTPAPAAVPVYDSIQIKFASYLRVNPEDISNLALYHFINRWMYTPYKWGGTDERGIDCSAFLQKLLQEVYFVNIPRTSILQFYTEKVEKFASDRYLKEGDLIFFRTIRNTYVSHVGLYLQNGMFVNSSGTKGVSIASLHDPYWKKRYVAAGRIKTR